jgi:glutathione S-transferase
MIDVLYGPTPKGWKVTIMLEACGLPCQIRPIPLSKGEPLTPESVAARSGSVYSESTFMVPLIPAQALTGC